MKWTKLPLVFLLSISFMNPAQASSFKDINGHWIEKTGAIQWAVDKQIVSGYKDGTFKPNSFVTEAEFLSMLLRAYEPAIKQPPNAEHWADGYYNRAKEIGFPIVYKMKKRYEYIERERVAGFVTVAHGANYMQNLAIEYVLVNGLASGKHGLSVKGFDGYNYVTRAEAIQMIKTLWEKDDQKLSAKRPVATEDDYKKLHAAYEKLTGEKAPGPLDYYRSYDALFQHARLLATWGRVSQQELDKRVHQFYQLGRKSRMVNGKLRVYLPQDIPADYVLEVGLETDNNNSKLLKFEKGKPVPPYVEIVPGSMWSFYVSCDKYVKTSGRYPVGFYGKTSFSESVSVNHQDFDPDRM